MLKKISTAEVRLGMYLHKLEGAWLDHPFWKTQFVLASQADVDALKASKVTAVWIDPAQGLDVAAPVEQALPLPAAAAEPAPPAAVPDPMVASLPPPPPIRTDLQSELGRATQILSRSKAAVIDLFQDARLGRAVDAESCLPLVEEISASVSRNASALISLARLKTKDDYTYLHSTAVCALMIALARQLGLSEEACREAGLAGLMHDLGKSKMPLEILNKPGKLTDEEFDIMRGHPARGHEMLTLGGSGTPEAVLDVCLHHHEKMDGTGYPHKLVGDQITQLARMGAICDVYDAVTSERPYKKPWGPAESLQRMAQWQGHFDPLLFQAFVRSVGIYPVGSLVRLHSGRLGVVVEQCETLLTKPKVKVFFSTKSKMPIGVEVIDLSQPGCSDRIEAREDATQWNFPHLDALWRDAV